MMKAAVQKMKHSYRMLVHHMQENEKASNQQNIQAISVTKIRRVTGENQITVNMRQTVQQKARVNQNVDAEKIEESDW